MKQNTIKQRKNSKQIKFQVFLETYNKSVAFHLTKKKKEKRKPNQFRDVVLKYRVEREEINSLGKLLGIVLEEKYKINYLHMFKSGKHR